MVVTDMNLKPSYCSRRELLKWLCTLLGSNQPWMFVSAGRASRKIVMKILSDTDDRNHTTGQIWSHVCVVKRFRMTDECIWLVGHWGFPPARTKLNTQLLWPTSVAQPRKVNLGKSIPRSLQRKKRMFFSFFLESQWFVHVRCRKSWQRYNHCSVHFT